MECLARSSIRTDLLAPEPAARRLKALLGHLATLPAGAGADQARPSTNQNLCIGEMGNREMPAQPARGKSGRFVRKPIKIAFFDASIADERYYCAQQDVKVVKNDDRDHPSIDHSKEGMGKYQDLLNWAIMNSDPDKIKETAATVESGEGFLHTLGILIFVREIMYNFIIRVILAVKCFSRNHVQFSHVLW